MSVNQQQMLDPKWGDTSPMHDPLILSNFEARETDVLITTAPKAGTTWMQQVLHQLRTNGDESFERIDDVVPWLEIQRTGKTWSEILVEFDKIDSPRVFKTHCTYSQTPGVDSVRIILSSRDPRDCCVSMYHHMMNLTDEALKKVNIQRPASFDAFFNSWFEFSAWYNNISSWWPHIDDGNILWLRYQDMKSDFECSLNQILSFLNWELDNRSKVLEYCSFEWMKENNCKFAHQDENRNSAFKSDTFIRKGSIGDYKYLLSTAQEKQILDHAYKTLEPACIDFLEL